MTSVWKVETSLFFLMMFRVIWGPVFIAKAFKYSFDARDYVTVRQILLCLREDGPIRWIHAGIWIQFEDLL